MPEAGRWATFGSGRNSAKFWRLSAQPVLEVAGLVFFLCLWRGISAKWGINRPKTLQNHSRQHRKTKFSELYLSDRHEADFGEEMLRFAVFMKHFSGSLASCRDRPLQNKNNVRVLIVYQITDVTRPQTHRVVGLCLVYGVWRANCNKIFDGMQSILISRFSQT